MKIIDRAFTITSVSFLIGAVTGAVTVYSEPFLERQMAMLIEYRIIGPVQTAIFAGTFAVFLLIVANNMFPVLLSFLYPVLLAKIHWTPPLSATRLNMLLSTFSILCGFLIGFLDLGGTLTVAFMLGGQMLLNRLIGTSWLHGPLEFISVLLAVSEPLRLVNQANVLKGVKKDSRLLLICLTGLLVSAIIEVYLHL